MGLMDGRLAQPYFGRNWQVVAKDDPFQGKPLEGSQATDRKWVRARVDAETINKALFDTYNHVSKMALDELRLSNEQTNQVSMVELPDGYKVALTGSDNLLYRALAILAAKVQALGSVEQTGFVPPALRGRSFSKAQKAHLASVLRAARMELVTHPDRRLLMIEI